jgi:hypothetical protein
MQTCEPDGASVWSTSQVLERYLLEEAMQKKKHELIIAQDYNEAN